MNTPWSELRREAEDPSTSARRLAELAVQDPHLWEVILRHPNCDPSYREWILAQRPDLRAVAIPAAAPAAHRQDPAPAVVPTRGSRTRRRVLPVLAVLGMLVLVFALGAGGTLWWVSRADADRDPAPAAGAEQTRPQRSVETSPEAEDADPVEEPSSEAEASVEDTSEAPTASAASDAPESTTSAEADSEATEPWMTEGEETTVEEEGSVDEVTLVISSPSSNIGCELAENWVGCTIRDRDVDAVGCPDHPTASFAIVDGSAPFTQCDVQFLGEVGDSVTVLEYGESISFGGATCSSESDGMTCWDDETGHSMVISRNGVGML